MTIINDDKNSKEEKLDNDLTELQEEISELDKKSEENKEEVKVENDELLKLKEIIARTQADYQNFKMRSERDKEDMIFYIKYDIFKKILPRIDDLERIIKNTQETEKTLTLYQWIVALEKALKKDLNTLWVKQFNSIWNEVDPSKHDVIAKLPSETPWVIIDELEKWYTLDERILRVAKVIIWT